MQKDEVLYLQEMMLNLAKLHYLVTVYGLNAYTLCHIVSGFEIIRQSWKVMARYVVYFDHQTDALHAVRLSKSFFGVLKLTTAGI